MSNALTDSQLLAISTLAYRIDRARDVRVGDTVGILARNIGAVLQERQEISGSPASANASQLMSYKDWYTLVGSITAQRELASLEVADVCIDSHGAKMMLLSDEQGNAYAVFAGTGAGEWEDNAIAAYSQDSLQQLSALSWFLYAMGRGTYEHVTACGHSKGGNKAMYLAVRAADVLDRAVCFDAQGFSRQFVQAYGDDILANTDKITWYALDNDYVSGLLSCIALPSKRLYLDGSHVENPPTYHSPFALFVPQHGASGTVLELGMQTRQGAFGKVFKDFSVYVQDNVPAGEYEQVCSFVGAAIENILTPHRTDSDRAARAVELATSDGCRMLLSHMAGFFETTRQNATPLDIISFLLPSGKRGATIVDDVAIGALETVSALLKKLTR